MSKEPFKECPRYSSCNANHCPLDPLQDERDDYRGMAPNTSEKFSGNGPDETCGLGKTYRLRIAAEYPELLPRMGMRPREYAAYQRWQNLPEAEKQLIRERGRAALRQVTPKPTRQPEPASPGTAKRAETDFAPGSHG